MARHALIGDVGGTNARFALVAPGAVQPEAIRALPCADFAGITDAVHAYLGDVDADQPHEACLAFACPVHDDAIRMTNNHWRFSRRAVQAELGLQRFKVINDFTAQALGVPHVAADQLVPIGGGEADPASARLVIGPGTGLGMAGVVPGRRNWIPLTTEGGHVAFAPTDAYETEVLRAFRSRYGRVSVERILCGQGLLELYRTHTQINGLTPDYTAPAEVTAGADAGDPVASAVVDRFLKILGDVCGDAALALGARGGVYLGGGIVPRLLDRLPGSGFRAAFTDKGRMSDYTAGIPTLVVTAEWTGLLGAAEALHNEEVA
ncbi:glucokinase [Aquisalimonas asiatica]|uniref:Glucokinase n=1 Tax=Aquisalimonas asiatica TaxID=406100 RepID=A0A1H8RJG0_9GAMM|nr:glucokinase [Aquisalimonas asiatica]SEO66462.1 glucokinase [Aquisalimonas asiatica]